jgi:RND family efflux transporter MFP subunit
VSATAAPKKRRRWLWWVVLGAAVVVVAAAVALSGVLGSSSTDTSLLTATVTKTDLTATVSGSGSLVAEGVTQVDPGITGTVEDLSVKLGDTVAAGQLLFRLVNDDLDSAVTRAKASYQQSKQQVQQAQIGLTKAQSDLYKTEHPSSVGTAPPPPVDATAVKLAKQQVTLAQMEVTSAKLGQTSSSQALAQAEDNADKRTVKATVGGLVTALNAVNGQALGSGSSGGQTSSSGGAAEISDLATLRASVQINEVDLVKVKLGQKATITYDALPDSSASGTVTAIAPKGTSTQGVVTYDVTVTLEKIDPRLRPNMSCTVEIVTETKAAALVVPTAAIKVDSTTNQKYVLVVSERDGSTSKTDVKTGLVVGTTTEVLSGVTEGQTVVTSSSSSSSSSGGNLRGGPGGGMGEMLSGGRD